MKVILLQDIKNVGKREQMIEANDGYARNYLFPKKLAIEATKDNLAKLQAKARPLELTPIAPTLIRSFAPTILL